jgi:ketosteroid isomerase-like protein
MSQENVEIIRRIAEAFERGGLDKFREYYHPDIEWHEDPSFPEAGVYRGLEAVEAYNRQFLSEFAEMHYEPQELIDANEHVIANMRIQGRGKASGATFDLSAWWVFTLRDGRLIRVHAYLDRTRALEAVGLRE